MTECSYERTKMEQAIVALEPFKHLNGAKLVFSLLRSTTVNVANEMPYASSSIQVSTYEYSKCILSEQRIEKVDKQTISDVTKRITKLQKLMEADYNLGFYEEGDIKKREIEDLIKYVKESTTPNGNIKYFPTSETKEYQKKFQDYRYLLKKLQITDPEVYHYLKKHVKTGIPFEWVSDSEKTANHSYDDVEIDE